MSESEEGDLWKAMDDGLAGVIADDRALAAHGAMSRVELEPHMATAHGIVARTQLVLGAPQTDGSSAFEQRVTPLAEVRDATLAAGHWRLHAIGDQHRVNEGGQS